MNDAKLIGLMAKLIDMSVPVDGKLRRWETAHSSVKRELRDRILQFAGGSRKFAGGKG